MNDTAIREVLARLQRRGPDRVLLDEEGTATSARRAREEHNTSPEVVFVRNDGWCLGAPAHLENAARATWEGRWVARTTPPFETFERLDESTCPAP